MQNNLAPICLFTYNRLEETKKTVAALRNNFLASESELFIFSDGPNKDNQHKVDSVRDYINTIKGFKRVSVFESKINKGFANSIIDGVTQIINQFGHVIVLEDDLVTTPNFLDFMNQSLNFYSRDDSVFSISGYTMDLKSLKKYNNDFYFGYRASSWGWATWQKDWQSVDWDVISQNEFMKSKSQKKSFNTGGSDMSLMLNAQINGKIDSWAIRFCYQQFLNKQACVFPKISKVQSIGFSKEATHTHGARKFITVLDNSEQRDFTFKKFIEYDINLVNEFKGKFSIKQRIIDNLLKIMYG